MAAPEPDVRPADPGDADPLAAVYRRGRPSASELDPEREGREPN